MLSNWYNAVYSIWGSFALFRSDNVNSYNLRNHTLPNKNSFTAIINV